MITESRCADELVEVEAGQEVIVVAVIRKITA